MLLQMFVTPLTVVVVAANVLGGAMALPQAAKLARSRRVDGVSAAWAGISAAVNAWWVAYGFGIGDLGIVPVSAVSVIAYVAIAVCLVRFGPDRALRTTTVAVLSGTGIAAIPLAVLLAEGWGAAGVVLGTLYGVQLSPAVVAVYRAPDVSGVSAATWSLAFLEAAAWGVYGFARLDPGLLTLAATGLAMSALVLLRLYVRRPRRDADVRRLGLATA